MCSFVHYSSQGPTDFGIHPDADSEQRISYARAAAALTAYARHWQTDPRQVTGALPAHWRPITNPATGRSSRKFVLAVDERCLTDDGGRRLLIEPVITRDEIESADGALWRRLTTDAASLVASAGADRAAQGVLFDVVRQPELRPRHVPRGSAKRSRDENRGTREEIALGAYCGLPLPAEDIASILAAVDADDGRETLDLFALRVEAEMVAQSTRYFQRRVVLVTPEDRQRAAAELWQVASDLRIARLRGAHYRNSAACLAHGRACELLALCSGHASPGSDAWVDCLATPEVGGSPPPANAEVLSPARLRTFQLCRRKHFYRYEAGMRSAESLAAEPHRFSSLLRPQLVASWKQPTD
jgi:hypothetical protein